MDFERSRYRTYRMPFHSFSEASRIEQYLAINKVSDGYPNACARRQALQTISIAWCRRIAQVMLITTQLNAAGVHGKLLGSCNRLSITGYACWRNRHTMLLRAEVDRPLGFPGMVTYQVCARTM